MIAEPSDVLVLNPDPAAVRPELADHAAENHWRMEQIDTIGDALRLLRRHQPRAAILPVWLSGLSDLTRLIAELRARRPDVPLVAVNTDADEAAANDLAGDDFDADDEAAFEDDEALAGERDPETPVGADDEHDPAPQPSAKPSRRRRSDQTIERAVRAAGATCYVTLAGGGEALRRLVESLVGAAPPGPYARRTSASVPRPVSTRIRGRPPPRELGRADRSG